MLCNQPRRNGDLGCLRVCVASIWTPQLCFSSKIHGTDSVLSLPERSLEATPSSQQLSLNIQKVWPNLFSKQIPSKRLISLLTCIFWWKGGKNTLQSQSWLHSKILHELWKREMHLLPLCSSAKLSNSQHRATCSYPRTSVGAETTAGQQGVNSSVLIASYCARLVIKEEESPCGCSHL